MSSTPTYIQEFRARWVDMDYNQHMRNSAFLGCSEETRMRFLDSHGWNMEEFTKRRLGPVVLEDRLIYKKELKLLEGFTVDLCLAGATDDGRRMKLRSHFYRDSDQALAAVVESVVMWFDLDARKTILPPAALKDAWFGLSRTDDFLVL